MITRTRFKLNISKHAQFRLKQRFGKSTLGKIYEDDVECLGTLNGAKKLYLIKNTEIVILKNSRSKNVITFLTKPMLQNIVTENDL